MYVDSLDDYNDNSNEDGQQVSGDFYVLPVEQFGELNPANKATRVRLLGNSVCDRLTGCNTNPSTISSPSSTSTTVRDENLQTEV